MQHLQLEVGVAELRLEQAGLASGEARSLELELELEVATRKLELLRLELKMLEGHLQDR